MLTKGFQVSIVNQQYGAMSYLICTEGIGFEAMAFYDDANYYLPINITSNPANAQLQWGLAEDESEVIGAYYHYIDGTKQDGIFLGAHNVTSWGVQQQDKYTRYQWRSDVAAPPVRPQKRGPADWRGFE